MATNISARWQSLGPDGRGSETAVTVSLADVVVNTTPTATGGWNTATVTADLARSHVLGPANGVPQGTYEKVDASASPVIFRMQPELP